jgi:hypothetical protein
MKQLLLSTILAAGAICLAACGGNPSDPGSRLTGNLHGVIEVLDECRSNTDGGGAGVTITIEGTSFTTTTNANGAWEVKGLPAGTYTITYGKPGYFTEKVEGFQFVGGGDAYVSGHRYARELQLRQIPTWTFGQIEARRTTLDSAHDVGMIRIQGAMTPLACGPGNYRTAWIFFNDNSNVSSTVHKNSFEISPDGGTQLDYPINTSTLHELGFASGATVYAIAYPTSYVQSNRDPFTGAIEVVGVGPTPSNIFSFVVP